MGEQSNPFPSSARAQAKEIGNTSMGLASQPSGGFSSGDSGGLPQSMSLS